MILNDAVRQALTAGHLAHLVTLNSDGSPHISVVWVGLDGDEIVCAHLGSWKKVKNHLKVSRYAQALSALLAWQHAQMQLIHHPDGSER